MSSRIIIRTGEISITATLSDNLTADKIFDALPFEGKGNRWGEEIYFTIPVSIDEAEDARQEMAVGELAYWPSGSAFCIFFGPTPVSKGDVPRAYSNVNPFGHIDDDASPLRNVPDGELIKIEKLET